MYSISHFAVQSWQYCLKRYLVQVCHIYLISLCQNLKKDEIWGENMEIFLLFDLPNQNFGGKHGNFLFFIYLKYLSIGTLKTINFPFYQMEN